MFIHITIFSKTHTHGFNVNLGKYFFVLYLVGKCSQCKYKTWLTWRDDRWGVQEFSQRFEQNKLLWKQNVFLKSVTNQVSGKLSAFLMFIISTFLLFIITWKKKEVILSSYITAGTVQTSFQHRVVLDIFRLSRLIEELHACAGSWTNVLWSSGEFLRAALKTKCVP